MKYYELKRQDAQKIYEDIVNGTVVINDNFFAKLDNDYKKIRKEILSWIEKNPVVKNYDFDLRFAIMIHEYFSEKNFEEFNEAIASNYGFWRFICLKVIPDIINERHGYVKEYFYDKNVRLYISTLWWYIEMCYQGNYEQTYQCLKKRSTDYILQIVERPGRDGMFLDVSRLIVYYLSKLPDEIVNKKYNNQTLLRRIAIQNTAKSSNYNLIFENKADEYVKGLFSSCGVEVDDYGIK